MLKIWEGICSLTKTFSTFGYHKRFEPTLEKSIKKRKYDNQSLSESLNDTPRLETSHKSIYSIEYGIQDPEETRNMFFTLFDHSRVPGTFDYTKPQTFHGLFPDVEQDAYITIDGSDHRKLKISNYSI